MGFFNRARRDDVSHADPIEDFWDWWQAEGASATAAAIAEGEPARLVDELSPRVEAIHEDLAWELSAGEASEHRLVVTAAGNPELRAPARRWLKAAPPATATWSYADSREPDSDIDGATLEIDGRTIRFDEVVITARRDGLRIPVTVFHPVFPDVDDKLRLTITFLALDAVVGQTDVECWVGEVTAAEEQPMDAFPLKWLRGLVRDLKQEFSTPDGEPPYVMYEAQGTEGPILAMAQVPLAAATAPELDTHVAVFLPYLSTSDSGLPSPSSLDALRRLEDGLTVDLEDRGRIVAHQSSAGTRVLHVYVDGATDAAELVRTAARRWTEGSASVTVTHDPSWDMVSHLRG